MPVAPQTICSAIIDFFLFLNKPLRQIILGSTGTIFDKFSSHDRYLILDQRSSSLVLIIQGTVPWQRILGSKSATSAHLPTFIALTF